MKFWIVTPSYNQESWLRLCIQSIADQAEEGIEIHHHVQDAGSTDGTVDFLDEQQRLSETLKPDVYSFSYESVPDKGMYDAINKGWERAPADYDILAYLNCDEQYEQGALLAVSGFFNARSEVDVAMGNMVVVDVDGKYICQRRPQYPLKAYSYVEIPGFTCTTFLRRRVFFEKGIHFNIQWRDIGDKEWFIEMQIQGCRFGMLNYYTSIFTSMPTNMNLGENARREKIEFNRQMPALIKPFRVLIVKHNRLRYLIRMCLGTRIKNYSQYKAGGSRRETVEIERTKWLWGMHHELGEQS